jgi:hypothetical protein
LLYWTSAIELRFTQLFALFINRAILRLELLCDSDYLDTFWVFRILDTVHTSIECSSFGFKRVALGRQERRSRGLAAVLHIERWGEVEGITRWTTTAIHHLHALLTGAIKTNAALSVQSAPLKMPGRAIRRMCIFRPIH